MNLCTTLQHFILTLTSKWQYFLLCPNRNIPQKRKRVFHKQKPSKKRPRKVGNLSKLHRGKRKRLATSRKHINYTKKRWHQNVSFTVSCNVWYCEVMVTMKMLPYLPNCANSILECWNLICFNAYALIVIRMHNDISTLCWLFHRSCLGTGRCTVYHILYADALKVVGLAVFMFWYKE